MDIEQTSAAEVCLAKGCMEPSQLAQWLLLRCCPAVCECLGVPLLFRTVMALQLPLRNFRNAVLMKVVCHKRGFFRLLHARRRCVDPHSSECCLDVTHP